ncbi:MAG TPA: hypothetical protein VFL57_11640 [Bryobacteraceae bacterium]|nr:hypothetical protein [Bryobacteraceae bacterium]
MRECKNCGLLLAGVLLLAGDPRVLLGQTVSRMLIASLDSGSFAGTRFPVSFSYDAGEVSARGDSFIMLRSFDFALRGVAFTRNDIFQGGQAIFRNGKLANVTASFQVRLPADAPLRNLTFGFGGDGVIGYVDLENKYGAGSFVFTTASAVVNAASFALNQPLAPGSLASIFGTGLAVSTARAGLLGLPTELAAVSVAIGGVPAPLQYVSPTQINLQVPWNLPAGTADVRITTHGSVLPRLQVSIVPYWPAIFSVQGGIAVAINPDGSIAAPAGTLPEAAAHAAQPGDYIAILGTGLGAVSPAIADGRSATDGLRTTLITPRVLISGVSAEVTFSGLSPQFPGVNQINAIVPLVAAGLQPLQLEMGPIRTTDQIAIAVGGHQAGARPPLRSAAAAELTAEDVSAPRRGMRLTW